MYLSVSSIATSVHFVELCVQQLKGGCVYMYAFTCMRVSAEAMSADGMGRRW